MSSTATGELSGELAGPGRILTLEESAQVFGGFRHLELQLFVHLGQKAAQAEPAEVAVWASAASLGAAWRADLLAGLLPVSKGLPGIEDSTRSAGPLTDLAVGRLAGLQCDLSLVRSVAGELLPPLLEAYGIRRVTLSEAADGPVALLLSRLVNDLSGQLQTAGGLLIPPGRGA